MATTSAVPTDRLTVTHCVCLTCITMRDEVVVGSVRDDAKLGQAVPHETGHVVKLQGDAAGDSIRRRSLFGEQVGQAVGAPHQRSDRLPPRILGHADGVHCSMGRHPGSTRGRSLR